ncbi:MAG: MFS transporter [Caldilineaceae bacterium]
MASSATTKPLSLWRNRAFVNLWSAQTISAIGSKVTFLALPLTAVLVLAATPAQMGYLTAVGSLPGLLFSLLAGLWVDRQRRRRLLVLADLGRGLLLLSIPLAVWFGALQITLLYAILFLIGTLDLLFGAAYHAYLPSLVARPQLVDANSKLEISRSAAEITGPTLGGWLIQLFSAPFALLADATSFFLSALCLAAIRQPEAESTPADKDEPLLRQVGAGLRLLRQDRTLRAITVTTATATFFNAALEAVYLLYMTRQLGLSAGVIGIIFGAGSVGFLVGSLLPNRLAGRFGLGPMLIAGLALFSLSDFVLPLATGPQALVVALLIGAQICFGLGLTLYNVGQVSLRQSVTPDHLLGRMNATLNFAVAGLLPLGALLGGWAGEWLGLRPTLLLAASGELLAILWLLFSPVRSLRS